MHTLNHIYRLVWSEASQTFVAVAENTSGRGKRSRSGRAAAIAATLLAAGACTLGAATELPTNGTVTAGGATSGLREIVESTGSGESLHEEAAEGAGRLIAAV